MWSVSFAVHELYSSGRLWPPPGEEALWHPRVELGGKKEEKSRNSGCLKVSLKLQPSIKNWLCSGIAERVPHVDSCKSFPFLDPANCWITAAGLKDLSLAKRSKANECGFHLLHLRFQVKASFLATRTSVLVESMAFTVTNPHHVQAWYESGHTLW